MSVLSSGRDVLLLDTACTYEDFKRAADPESSGRAPDKCDILYLQRSLVAARAR